MQSIPADVVALADYERYGVAMMPAPIAAYIQGAGADGHTLAENLSQWAQIRLQGRVLADMRGAHTGLTLLGLSLEHPLVLAPVAFHGLVHPEGEAATALGAGATGALMCVSTQAGQRLEDIAAHAPGPLWFQLYMQPRREDTLDLLRRAEAAGYRALVLTVDAPVNGLRNIEQRAGFALPPDIAPVNLATYPQPEVYVPPGRSPVFLGLLDHAPTWEDIAWLRSQTQLPLLLKGVMAAQDAVLAKEMGADGLIVSNHGGRALDTLAGTAAALPQIAAAVGQDMAILVDGGIRRGSDVLKARALGADAVLIGRPQIHALAVGGAAGVAHMITILRAELEVAMALTGCRTLHDIGPEVLWQAR